MMKEELIPKEFGFPDFHAVKVWAQTLNAHYRFNANGDTCLYTDGDDGIAIIRLSEVFDDAGIDIELIDCKYCGFDYFELGHIFDQIVSVANDWGEE